MKNAILPPPQEKPGKRFWKPWKWVGLIVYALALVFRNSLPGPVVAAAYLYGLFVIAGLLFSLLRYLKDRLFWRVRHRLIASFIFVGVIPLLIFAGLVALSAYILMGRLAGEYLNQALQEYNREVSRACTSLASRVSREDMRGEFPAKADMVFSANSSTFPSLGARLLQNLPDGNLHVVARHDPRRILPDIGAHPGNRWRGKEPSFEGLLTHHGGIFLTSLQPVPQLPGCFVEMAAPLDAFLEERLRKEKSLYIRFIAGRNARVAIGDGDATIEVDEGGEKRVGEADRRVRQKLEPPDTQPAGDGRVMVTWYLSLRCKVYETGENDTSEHALLRVDRSALLQAYFGGEAGRRNSLLTALYILAGMFLCAELISLLIGIVISRRITRSVHDLYQGIQALQKGDLNHRIPVRRDDQLGLLAHSFNHMTASIERLLGEVVEKERLEQELEIAREVQATLFPKQLPRQPGMEVFGGCRPARAVSGDYYDFVVEDERRLHIVVGDVSGKGISAALLMANLQAAMRSQLLAHGGAGGVSMGQRLAEIMGQLNGMVHLNSPPEKYATLFLGSYDAGSRTLWYCNAGHLPPIVLDGGGVHRLEPTGTVVGLLPYAVYQTECVGLNPGALLAIYTDGITEAVNPEGEEFGEARLLEALRDASAHGPEAVWNHVLSRVMEWQGGLAQHDDITLVVAKVV